MANIEVRGLTGDDFAALEQLERNVFGAAGEAVLCQHYLRLCCEFFGDSCFIALADGRPIGYLLSFVRGREVYCTTLAIVNEFQRTRATVHLLRAFLDAIIDRVDTCWFTVDEGNTAARNLHRMLGATEVGVRPDFYGPGQDRIVSRIDRARFEALEPKYVRLGLVAPPEQRARARAA